MFNFQRGSLSEDHLHRAIPGLCRLSVAKELKAACTYHLLQKVVSRAIVCKDTLKSEKSWTLLGPVSTLRWCTVSVPGRAEIDHSHPLVIIVGWFVRMHTHSVALCSGFSMIGSVVRKVFFLISSQTLRPIVQKELSERHP